jgi:hypothetical protein
VPLNKLGNQISFHYVSSLKVTMNSHALHCHDVDINHLLHDELVSMAEVRMWRWQWLKGMVDEEKVMQRFEKLIYHEPSSFGLKLRFQRESLIYFYCHQTHIIKLYYILASCCTVLFHKFWGYVAVCVQLYCRWQESKHAHKNQETNENTTEKHKWKRA